MKKFFALLPLIFGFLVWRYLGTHHPDLPGYQTDLTEVQREYEKLYGAPLESGDIEKGFADARTHIHRGEYRDAIAFFRSSARAAALPVFYNNLAVLYMATKDFGLAYAALHQALARDPAYPPALDNLKRLQQLHGEMAQLEIEPNNTTDLANDIAVGAPISGEITAGLGDTDVFAFTTPSGPRDLLQVELENRSRFFAPRIRVLDAQGVTTAWDAKAAPGEKLKQVITAKPNTLLYLELSGVDASGGTYRLTVNPLKAFDAHEPNDTVFQATELPLGKPLEANIMDDQDTDFYSILPSNSGTMTINVGNQSTTLRPGITMLGSDKSTIGFGPEVAPGQPVKVQMQVEGGHAYYVQVWSQGSTAGAYSIAVTQP